MLIVIDDLMEVKFPNIIASLSLDCCENQFLIGYFSKEDNISLDGISTEDFEEGDEDILEIINTFDSYLNQIDITNIHTIFFKCDNTIILDLFPNYT